MVANWHKGSLEVILVSMALFFLFHLCAGEELNLARITDKGVSD